jgi:hypothetical protein
MPWSIPKINFTREEPMTTRTVVPIGKNNGRFRVRGNQGITEGYTTIPCSDDQVVALQGSHFEPVRVRFDAFLVDAFVVSVPGNSALL